MSFSQDGQWAVQGKVSYQGICSKEGYWLQWDDISCSQAYIYSVVIDDSCSVWSKVEAVGCQNSISARWARGEYTSSNLKGTFRKDKKARLSSQEVSL